MGKITVNGNKHLEVEAGGSLLAALHEHKIPVPSVCGGRGICGTCKVRVLKGAGPLLEAELRLLSDSQRADNIRLSCQVRVGGDIEIKIPEELLAAGQYKGRCTKIEDLNYDTKRFCLELTEPSKMEFVPGRYVQLLCPSYKEGIEPAGKAYSIASDPKENNLIDLIIRKVPNGICTTWCFEYLKEGDEVEFTGPYGQFGLSRTDLPMVFVAGGSGIAPFVSILHWMKNTSSRRKTEFFFGANMVKDLCLIEQMKQFEKDIADFKFIPVAAEPQRQDNWQGETGLVTEAIQRHYSDLSGYEGYLCGSPGMIDAAAKVLEELKMPEEKIFYDKFE